jgi:anti-anti-sigma factor
LETNRLGKGAVMIEIQMPDSSTAVCRPVGELDLATLRTLREVISELARQRLSVMIDLADVNVIDATGASALVSSVRRVADSGGTIHVTGASPGLQWLLELLGGDRLRAKTSVSFSPMARGQQGTSYQASWTKT